MTKYTLIDLSYPITDDMLVFPNTERPTFSWRGRVSSEGFNLTRMSMLVHTGTHADSPLHFISDGQPIDEVPLSSFYGETRVFRSTKRPNSQEVMIADIMESEDEIEEGSIFVLETGIEIYAGTSDYNECFPVPSQELIELLIRKRVRCYMTDATSIDHADSKESENHKAILGAGIPIVENLKNLSKLPMKQSFVISAFPVLLAGREGSLCRAVALI